MTILAGLVQGIPVDVRGGGPVASARMTADQPLTVRREQESDVQAVHALIATAFEDESVARLKEELLAAPAGRDGLSFVGELDGTVVAHVLYTRNLLDAPRRLVDVLVLSPMAVHPDHQGRGLGSELIRRSLDSLGDSGFPLVFLEGSPAYYARLGFVPGGDLGFRKPSLRIPDAAFQVHALASHEPWMTGTLVYDQLFWQMDCVGLRDPDA